LRLRCAIVVTLKICIPFAGRWAVIIDFELSHATDVE
jgi:hypothetical protein